MALVVVPQEGLSPFVEMEALVTNAIVPSATFGVDKAVRVGHWAHDSVVPLLSLDSIK